MSTIKGIIVNLSDSSADVDVKFVGGHLNKRELLRALKAIKLEYRHSIIRHRKQLTLSKEKEDADRSRAESESESRTRKEGQSKVAAREQGV